MKIILLKRIRGLGQVGDLVTVKDGFGRNFLIPQNLAVRATSANEERIQAQKVELEAQNKEALKLAEAANAKIEGKDISFIKQCADDGRLFGSVSAKDIAKEVQAVSGIEVSHSSVFLNNPIKSLGIYDITISIHADVSCNILVNVARSESEAKDALKEHKAALNKDSTTLEEDGAAA